MEEEKDCDEAECPVDDTMVVVVVLVIIILAIGIIGGGGGYILYKKSSTKPVVIMESDPRVLVKDKRLKDKLTELTEDPRLLFREFQQLETEVLNTVQDTAVVGEINKPHNRYGDVLPFDNNLVTLEKASGEKIEMFYFIN